MDQSPSPSANSWPAISRDLLLIALVGAVVCFSFLGSETDWGSHETRHALIAAQMAETGDFFVPVLFGKPYPDKPPVMHAAIAVLFRAFGRVSMLLARTPSALAAIVGALAVFGLGTVLDDRRTGRWAGLAILGTIGYARLGRIVRPDMVFVAGLVVSCWALAAGLAARAKGRRAIFLAIGGFAAGGATLTKGPYGIIFPLVFLALALVGRRDFGRPRGGEWWLMLGAFLLLPGVWVIPVYLRDQGHYLASVVFQRDLTTMMAGLRRPFYWYLGPAPLYLLPFTVFLPWVARDWWRESVPSSGSRPPVAARHRVFGALRRESVAAWMALAVLVVLSWVPGKRENYLGPWYPFAVLAVAAALARRAEIRWLWRSAWTILALSLLAQPVYYGARWLAWGKKNNDERVFAVKTAATVVPGGSLIVFKGMREPESVAFILYEQHRPHAFAVASCHNADQLTVAVGANERTRRPCYLAVREKELPTALAALPQLDTHPLFSAVVDGQRWLVLRAVE